MKHRVEDLERRVSALEKAQGASAASQMGKLSRKNPTEAQRAASRANGAKGGRRRKKPNDTAMKNIIEKIWKDDDGWWAILASGWKVDGCTGVREDTKKLLMERIKDAKKEGAQ
jgi:hypothetical protein